MNFLKEIKNRGVIDETLLPLIFGDLLDDSDYWYEVDYDLPRLGRDIIIFYFGLTQAYCFAVSQHKNKTLSEVNIPGKVISKISKMWDVDDEDGFSSEGDIFSYFITCSDSDDKNLFTPSTRDNLITVYKAYEDLTKNARIMFDPIERETFFAFLESLPLLRNTSFSNQTMKFKMKLEDAVVSIKASPFISFLSFDNGPIGEPVESITAHRYVLFAVSKGDANNELFFDTVRLDESGGDSDKRRLCRKVQSNEGLTLICKTANIKTNWYSMDDCWCDLKFLNKMVDASEQVLLNCCGITDVEYQAEVNIRDALLNVFSGTELYDTILSYNSAQNYDGSKPAKITVKEINGLLFKLFLTEGLFETVRCIVFNPHGKGRTSREIFDLYLDVLIALKTTDAEGIAQIKTVCDRKIATAVDKLSHIVSKKSEIYKRRTLEIHAEWKTFYILQAAGIKSNNLFADVETILSIDDYYDMIGNDDYSIESDLIQLLETMCVFYSALLENTAPFDEERYYADVERIAPQYVGAGRTLDNLFDAFLKIAERSENTPHLEDLLGRRGIGVNAVKYIRFCKNQILSEMKHPTQFKLSLGSTGYGIFVSYAHEDYDLVKPIVERWKEMGLKFFFDESDIHHGQNWQRVAEDAMDREECKLVVAFFSKKSVCKEAVSMEIEHANLWRSRKYPEDPAKQGMFIIPINLEREPIKTYLPEIANTHPDIEGARAYAKKIYKCISGEDVFVDYHTSTEAELDQAILNDYEKLADNDGRVVPTHKFDGFKLAVANFYAFLKYGSTSQKDAREIHRYFNDENADFSRCIFPIVTSVKEARIKRDNIAIVGYELIRGKGRKKSRLSHILTSRTLEIYDYYCIPKYRNSAELKDWMVEPLLIRCDRFIEILSKAKEKNNV